MKKLSVPLLALFASSILVASGAGYPPQNAFAQDTEAAGDLVAASGSNRFVVWEDDSTGNFDILFKRSADDGVTWKPNVNLSGNPGDSTNAEIVVSGSNVYVVWMQANVAGTATDIFFRRSTDNGATWGFESQPERYRKSKQLLE